LRRIIKNNRILLQNHLPFMKRLLCFLLVSTVAFSLAAQGSFEAMLTYAPTGPDDTIYSPIYSGINGPVGWTFQPTTDIQVTALGAFDSVVPGSGSIEVGLWDSSGTLLASQAVSAADTAVGQSFYQAISSVLLAAGQTYFIAAFSSSGALQTIAVTPDSGPEGYATMSPAIQLGLAAYSSGSSFVFPGTTDGNPGDAIIGPNFEFQPVPESSVGYLLVAGTLGLIKLRRGHSGRKVKDI